MSIYTCLSGRITVSANVLYWMKPVLLPSNILNTAAISAAVVGNSAEWWKKNTSWVVGFKAKNTRVSLDERRHNRSKLHRIFEFVSGHASNQFEFVPSGSVDHSARRIATLLVLLVGWSSLILSTVNRRSNFFTLSCLNQYDGVISHLSDLTSPGVT